MTRKCIVCKKELPEGSKLPVCEYHKGVAAEKAKQVGAGAGALAVSALVMAKDSAIPVVKDKALPIARGVVRLIFKH